MEPALSWGTKAPQNCRNSPPVVTVVFRELLDEAENIYFTSIDSNSNLDLHTPSLYRALGLNNSPTNPALALAE